MKPMGSGLATRSPCRPGDRRHLRNAPLTRGLKDQAAVMQHITLNDGDTLSFPQTWLEVIFGFSFPHLLTSLCIVHFSLHCSHKKTER